MTHSRPAFADRNEAIESLTDMLGSSLTPEEQVALEAFLDEHYAVDEHAKSGRAYASDELREVRWAFISW